MTVAENIKRIRKEKGLTQKQLGERCGMSESTLRQYEIGYRNPKLETIQKIAAALHVSPSELDERIDALRKSHRLIGSMYSEMEKKRLKDGKNFEHTLEIYNKLIKAQMEISDKLAKDLTAEELEKILVTKEQELLSLYLQLNEAGKQKAIEDVENLTYNPKYKK